MSIKQTVQIFDMLLQGSFSRVQLAERIGVTPKFVGRVLQEMKAKKLIYVIDYTNETDGRNRVKVHALGNGVDATPKPSKTQRDRSRRSYARRVATQKRENIKTTFVGGVSLWQ